MGITWKEFKYVVETKISNHGIDLDAQPIEIDWIDVSASDIGPNKFDLNVNINTNHIPERVYITIS